jgi:hypothetical protein
VAWQARSYRNVIGCGARGNNIPPPTVCCRVVNLWVSDSSLPDPTNMIVSSHERNKDNTLPAIFRTGNNVE